MAECELKLPSELFGDGEKQTSWGNEHVFPYGDMGSDLSSPLSSTTETGSDEDYLDGLTRQMAHSFLLDDDDKDLNDFPNSKVSGIMATSPQSTLCGVGLWSGSGATSPNGRSLSPPLTASAVAAEDVLHSAARQVALMRPMPPRSEADKLYGRGLLGLPKNNYYLTQQQLKFEQLKLQQQQQMAERQGACLRQSKVGRSYGGGDGRCCGPLGLPLTAWPPLQGHQHASPLQPQHHQAQAAAGSGMRAVFLQNGGRRTSSGTGVFLPQRSGNQTQSRKKPVCSTVLLPARVVQALNLNLEDMGSHPLLPGTFVLDHDALLTRGNALKRSHLLRSQPIVGAAAAHEVRLPAEWTY